MESNHLPSGYEPPALTDELHPHNRDEYNRFRLLKFAKTSYNICLVARK